MLPVIQHPWDVSPETAVQLQQELATKVITQDQLGNVTRIAGVDVAYATDTETLAAAVVILDANSLGVIETVVASDVARFPYVPGLFSFRELPPLMLAMSRLQHTPDLVICDGQGIAHPRGCGLASHLGVIFDVPTSAAARRACWESMLRWPMHAARKRR